MTGKNNNNLNNDDISDLLNSRLMLWESPYGFAFHRLICDEQDMPLDYEFLEINPAFEQQIGLRSDKVVGRRASEVMPQVLKERFNWLRFFAETAMNGTRQQTDQYMSHLDRTYRIVAFSPRKGYFAAFYSDITEDQKRQKQIEYLSYHDQLTRLYNRHYFDDSLNRLDTQRNLPLTLIMVDVNGLKISNDTFGHAFGDRLLQEAAALVSGQCRADDIISRVGGDEFVIILPRTGVSDAQKIAERIKNAAAEIMVGSIRLSLSMGLATRLSMKEDVRETLKNAEDRMYREKLTESPRLRRMVVDVLMNRLNANPIEELHSRRVGDMCEAMGKAMSLGKNEVADLKKLGLLHDLGKITLAGNLISKPSGLSENEWNDIRRHSEISYRILSSIQEYADISEAALSHHERWDGKGYPRNLRGEEIPLHCRIIALADAYEAMTSDRPWRKAFSRIEAEREIRDNAGTQFDPGLVELFLKKVAPFY